MATDVKFPAITLVYDRAEIEWMNQAACLGRYDPANDIFFPEHNPETGYSFPRRVARARAVCSCCPVAYECMTYAQRHKIKDGIWGGMLPHERAKER